MKIYPKLLPCPVTGVLVPVDNEREELLVLKLHSIYGTVFGIAWLVAFASLVHFLWTLWSLP